MPNSALLVEDVVQEVVAAVVAALPNYHPQRAPFGAFVSGVTRHRVMDARRAAARSRVTVTAEPPERARGEPGPEDVLLERELAARLRRLLEVLPPYQRRVLLLRVMDGMASAEAAAVLRTTPVAVRVAQHRALSALRRAVEQGAGGALPTAPPGRTRRAG